MPSGLLIDLNDGGKAMEITSGLRCPSFGGSFDSGYQKNKYVDIQGFVSGSQVVPLLHSTVYLDSGLMHNMNSITISGGRVTQNSRMRAQDISERDSTYTFPGSVWQIFPVNQSSNTGLLISNSTDFTSITSATQSGQCIYMSRVNIPTGGWSLPTVPGYDRSRYIVFARWDSSDTLDFDGNTIRFFAPPRNGQSDQPRSGSADVVIFSSGVAPTPGLGLNMFNPSGQCTFSTTRRPMVYLNGLWTPSTNNVNIGRGYVPIGRFGLYNYEYRGNYFFSIRGIRMQGGNVSCQDGKYIGFANYAQFGNNVVGGLSLPVLPDMYL